MPPRLAPPTHPIERLPGEWADALVAMGEPKYRGLQVFRWIHHRGVVDPAAMTDLPATLRAKLAAELDGLPLALVHTHRSTDGTRKLLARMRDGADVETVLMPQTRGAPAADSDDDDDAPTEDPKAGRITQCISTQVGCAMGCAFCASGVAGLKRNLSAAEIVSQVLAGRNALREEPNARLRNVVLMGMGEPLHNYDAVARALVLMSHPDGIGLSTRRITLSTSGLVPQIDRLGADFDGQVALAVSLHLVDDVRRSAVMPINRKHPIADLIAALERYPLPKRRRITIEYTLLRGINDDPRDADTLVHLLRRVPIKVNLIPMNPVEGTPLSAPDWDAVLAFQDRLRSRHVSVFVRQRRGDDIAAACGQLALHGAKRRVKVRLPVRA